MRLSHPAPAIPGKTEFERFDNGVRAMLSISKEELLKREKQWKKAQASAKKKRAKKGLNTWASSASLQS